MPNILVCKVHKEMTCKDLTIFLQKVLDKREMIYDPKDEQLEDVQAFISEIETVSDDVWEILSDELPNGVLIRKHQIQAIRKIKSLSPSLNLRIPKKDEWGSSGPGEPDDFRVGEKGEVRSITIHKGSESLFEGESVLCFCQLSSAKYLTIADTWIKDPSFLSFMKDLEYLDLYRNNIDLSLILKEVKNLAKLKNLQTDNDTADISAFNEMDLEFLWINLKGVDDLTPLLHLKNLKVLWFRNGDALKTVAKISSLEHIEVTSNEDVTDYSPLLSMPNLKRFTSWGQTEQIGRNKEIVEELIRRGVEVDYD